MTTTKLPRIAAWTSALAIAAALLGAPAVGATTKTYQVTGPVLEVTDSTITVEKGKEKWQISRDKDTKVTGELKTGAKVTIEYRMTATSVEVKGSGDAGKGGDAKEKPKAKK
jgi:hypothetical protein